MTAVGRTATLIERSYNKLIFYQIPLVADTCPVEKDARRNRWRDPPDPEVSPPHQDPTAFILPAMTTPMSSARFAAALVLQRLACCTLFCILALPLHAQSTGTISGVISDSSGKYLEGAEISVDGTNLRTTA